MIPYNENDKKNIKLMAETDFGIFIATPGRNKTTIEALGSIKSRLEHGPIIAISRTKFLLEQIITDWVELINERPKKILLDSTIEKNDIQKTLINVYKNKTPTIIGCVGQNDTLTLKNLLTFCEKHNFPIRLLIDEALDILKLPNIDKELITLLEKLYTKGLIKMLHIYHYGYFMFGFFVCIFHSGPLSMNNKNIKLPNKRLIILTSKEALTINKTIPLEIIKHKIYEKDLLSRDHPIITADIKDKHIEKLHLTYVVTTDGSISQSSLALENIIDSIRSSGIAFKLTTPEL